MDPHDIISYLDQEVEEEDDEMTIDVATSAEFNRSKGS